MGSGHSKEIVLVGGGHAHVEVMRRFGERPEPGVSLTLVSRDLDTPYSGMLPGMIAGRFTRDEGHIDLVHLSERTGTRLVHASATGIDRGSKVLLTDGDGRIGYDLLSLDVGITPSLDRIEGAAEHGIAVKPIGRFLERFDALLADLRARRPPFRIAIVGGGAGGVELAISLDRHFRREGLEVRCALVTAGALLPTHNTGVRALVRRRFGNAGIELLENATVEAVKPAGVRLEDGRLLPADAVLVATGAAAPAWLAASGLSVDDGGFVTVGPTLQTLGDPSILAAGDCASMVETPREKAGVYAVRAGPPLAYNLRALAKGASPRPWHPQKRHLSLITTGTDEAVASWGPFFLGGRWLLRLKDAIDRRWMARYRA